MYKLHLHEGWMLCPSEWKAFILSIKTLPEGIGIYEENDHPTIWKYISEKLLEHNAHVGNFLHDGADYIAFETTEDYLAFKLRYGTNVYT